MNAMISQLIDFLDPFKKRGHLLRGPSALGVTSGTGVPQLGLFPVTVTLSIQHLKGGIVATADTMGATLPWPDCRRSGPEKRKSSTE
jgi:hypothetical protein